MVSGVSIELNVFPNRLTYSGDQVSPRGQEVHSNADYIGCCIASLPLVHSGARGAGQLLRPDASLSHTTHHLSHPHQDYVSLVFSLFEIASYVLPLKPSRGGSSLFCICATGSCVGWEVELFSVVGGSVMFSTFDWKA